MTGSSHSLLKILDRFSYLKSWMELPSEHSSRSLMVPILPLLLKIIGVSFSWEFFLSFCGKVILTCVLWIGFLFLVFLFSLFACCSLRMNRKAKVVPLFHLDRQMMSPPNSPIICLQMCRPSPMPLVFSYWVSYKYPKSLNILLRFSFLIPIPVSITWISSAPYLA